MTRLLELALDKVRRLSSHQQDDIAGIILAELEDEAHWQKQFRARPGKLKTLAQSARREIAQDEVLDRDPADYDT